MGTRRPSGTARHTDNITCKDFLSLGYEDPGQVTVTDRVDTMAYDDIMAATGIVAVVFYNTVEHGHDTLVVGLQVDSGMRGTFTCEGVFACTVRRGDFHSLQRIGHAHKTVYPKRPSFLHIIRIYRKDEKRHQ